MQRLIVAFIPLFIFWYGMTAFVLMRMEHLHWKGAILGGLILGALSVEALRRVGWHHSKKANEFLLWAIVAISLRMVFE